MTEIQIAIRKQYGEIQKRTRAIFDINKSIYEVHLRNRFKKDEEDYLHLYNLKKHRDANVVRLNDAKTEYYRLLNENLMSKPDKIKPKISAQEKKEQADAAIALAQELAKIKKEQKELFYKMETERSADEFKVFLLFLKEKLGKDSYLTVMKEFNDSQKEQREMYFEYRKQLTNI